MENALSVFPAKPFGGVIARPGEQKRWIPDEKRYFYPARISSQLMSKSSFIK